ncbi:hypothetical protein LTR82_018161 [Friedmanniomyces endolithicus]|uniref:O-methyltransferase C-terminal domain-containing protein n=1 Tax=Friedmanniomyces endolithicus TaxID=329885 RepID=A0AAN6F558_9PEZI|nr:hypothetical protein LTR82_018161 [Friedmanniomyces endolithicus]
MTNKQRIETLRELTEADAAGDGSAHHALLREIRSLQHTVETPIETTSRLNFQIVQNICLRIAIEKGLLQTIVCRDGEAITAGELEAATETDRLLITRVMPVLSALRLVFEEGEESYTANIVTRQAVTPGAIGALKHHFDLDMSMGGQLVDYMRRTPDNTIHQFAGEPEGNQTLLNFAHGHPTIFGLLSSDTDKGREQKVSFDDYMAGKRMTGSMQQWFDIYPASARLADARGGPGQEIVRLKERHPELPGRYVLQDLPITLDRVDSVPEGVEKMPYDFFTPQPVVGARAYFLRDIMHNWSDAISTSMLRNVAAAMDKDYSTLLIDQYVLPPTGADLRAAEMDILMLLHTSGLQRTLPMWKTLFSSAGLELVKNWCSDSSGESVLEVKKL